MADTNSFWLESMISDITPSKLDMGEYRRKDDELNNLLSKTKI